MQLQLSEAKIAGLEIDIEAAEIDQVHGDGAGQPAGPVLLVGDRFADEAGVYARRGAWAMERALGIQAAAGAGIQLVEIAAFQRPGEFEFVADAAVQLRAGIAGADLEPGEGQFAVAPGEVAAGGERVFAQAAGQRLDPRAGLQLAVVEAATGL